MKLTTLNNGHHTINGTPVYKIITRKREALKLSKGQFAKRYHIDRSTQYAFENGQNRSLKLAIRELEAVGYDVYINVL